MKKILALVLATMMLLGMVSALAASDFDTPLTVTGLGTGDTVKFYKIVEWVGEADGNVAGWKAISPYSDILTEAKLREVLVGTPAVAADPDNGIEAQDAVAATGITSLLAGQLADKAGNDGVDADSIENGIATLNNATSGLWMALVTPADANTIYNPVFVAADYVTTAGGTVAMTAAYADAVVKKSTVTLTKTAENTADYNQDHAQTTAIGDTVTFTVNTQIPGYGEVYQNPHFDVVDTLTDLTLDTDSVTVTVPSGLTKGTEYTVDATASGYRLSFSTAYLKTLKTATPVTITYDAVVATTAAKAINEEDNDVYIEYSHNPTDENDYDVKKDTTQHYTFTLDAAGAGLGSKLTGKKTSELVKIGLDAAGNPITQTTETSEITGSESWQGPLEGAEFALYKADQVNFGEDGKPTSIKAGVTAYKTASTGADGRMTFAGLDAGTYYLQETNAPAGYVTQSAIHTIVIAAQVDKVNVTEWWNGTEWVSSKPATGTAKEVTYETEILKSYTVKVDGEDTATYTFTNASTANDNEIKWETVEPVEHPFDLPNTKGTELPSTGGMGTTLFYIGGGLLALIAVVLLVTKRRMNGND